MASALQFLPGMRADNLPLERPSLFLLALTLVLTAAAAQAQDPKPEDDPPPDDGSGGSGGSGGDGSSTGSPPDHRLADSETSYTGAVMLEGGTDISFDGVVAGATGEFEGISRNARFIGNTLYAEAVDPDGNAVAMLSEFYWFESSVPRGSDFFVGVVKARTIPHLAADWVLEHDPQGASDAVRPDRGATLYVRATTNPELDRGSFRWDWSLPFRDYHMDAYGTIRMRADYGVGLMSNGSAQTAYQRNEHGVEVQVEAQSTGHLTTDYNVNTNYEITLYRWDVYTRNSGNMLEWSMFLRTSDRERQNAYHEYFIAMQVDEGGEFYIGNLEVGGHVKQKRSFWTDIRRALSVSVQNITLRRPEHTPPSSDPSVEDGGTRRPWEDDDEFRGDGGTSDFDWPDDDAELDGGPKAGGCSVVDGTGAAPLTGIVLVGVGLWLARRRRGGL